MGWWSYSDVQRIESKVDILMADLSQLQAVAGEIQGDVKTAIAKLDDLSRQLAEGGNVNQADIDAITEQLRGTDQALDDAVAGTGGTGTPTPGDPTPGAPDPSPPEPQP